MESMRCRGNGREMCVVGKQKTNEEPNTSKSQVLTSQHISALHSSVTQRDPDTVFTRTRHRSQFSYSVQACKTVPGSRKRNRFGFASDVTDAGLDAGEWRRGHRHTVMIHKVQESVRQRVASWATFTRTHLSLSSGSHARTGTSASGARAVALGVVRVRFTPYEAAARL